MDHPQPRMCERPAVAGRPGRLPTPRRRAPRSAAPTRAPPAVGAGAAGVLTFGPVFGAGLAAALWRAARRSAGVPALGEFAGADFGARREADFGAAAAVRAFLTGIRSSGP